MSDPYKKNITFEYYEQEANESYEISDENSKLRKRKYQTGFLPFVAKEILEILLEEYGNNIELEFEGTSEEFQELESLCLSDEYASKMQLSKGKLQLENAREVLPKIVKVYEKVLPLVESSVDDKKKVKIQLESFADASNEVIPVCVIGNYSSGKSSFINALIGLEILPSNALPTTAKVCKIIQSNTGKAKITFDIDGQLVTIELSGDNHKITSESKSNLLKKLTKC